MDGVLRVAVTGHRDLSPATAALIGAAISEQLRGHAPDILGVSCLAPGADQIFAERVLELGGTLKVIVPARTYGHGLGAGHRRRFHRLLSRAGTVVCLPYEEATPATYEAANEALLVDVDLLLAVWDGAPAQGRGGTAEVVDGARQRAIEVRVLWPEGASRTGRP
ncbi:hypothetical protein JOL79_09560 [Microbispora sp. RL4-1S]|uniref:Uncharacterized protein n=1 Tax=Microbispora oryzae TaxID=2806554 RepID=A0A941APU6_9ACTN|nr:hypothetical protein [Microbispora oryzae]MBP2704054.1 hypothetical protein [Microbispora oryzae]